MSWGKGAENNSIGWGQGDNNSIGWGLRHLDSWSGDTALYGVYTDPDAQAFITAASITDATQQSAVNQLVLDLKASNIWTKMKAVYPFVGGSATSNSKNLINPSTYSITWAGGLTHNSSGVTGSTNGYGNTGIAPNSALSLNSTHLSVFMKTAGGASKTPIGVCEAGYNKFTGIITDINIGYNAVFYDVNASNGGNTFQAFPSNTGFILANRTASNQSTIYRNGVSLGSNSVNSSSLSTYNITILALNNNGSIGGYSPSNLQFASIGDGLSGADITAFNTAVTTFNTTLGR